MSEFKLPRDQIAAFIPSERGVRAYEQMQGVTADMQQSVGAMEIAPSADALLAELVQRVASLENGTLPPAPPPLPRIDPLLPPSADPVKANATDPRAALAELAARVDRIEQAMNLLPRPQPFPPFAAAKDGTYASPTSITINGGLITAIS